MSLPSSHAGGRPLRPAPVNTPQRSEEADEVTSQSSMPLPKRFKVTPVACVPCQQRKSKCDGNRPICYACTGKGRTDCRYNSASDMRRTSALKQKIKELEKDKDDLETIIRAIAANPGDETVKSYVQDLPNSQFQSTADVSAALRGYSTSETAASQYSYPSQMQMAQNSSLLMPTHHTTAMPYTTSISPSAFAWSTSETVFPSQASSWEPTYPAQRSPWEGRDSQYVSRGYSLLRIFHGVSAELWI